MQKTTSHIKVGILTGLAVGLLSVLSLAFAININPTTQILLSTILLFFGIYFSINLLRKQNTDASFKDLFIQGFKTTTIITLAVVACGWIMLLTKPSIKKELYDNWVKEDYALFVKDSTAQFTQLNANRDSIVAQKTKDSLIVAFAENRKAFAKNKELFKSRFNIIFIGQNILLCMVLGIIATAVIAFASLRKTI